MPQECRHSPRCPEQISRWTCGQRTAIEDTVARGFLRREVGESLLKKYGCPMTPASKVFRGESKPSVLQSELDL